MAKEPARLAGLI